ncbi:MAG: NAD(P)/FAD-dependent oxidoreductase [Nitrospinota bacterium]
MEKSKTVEIVGAGPAGLVAALSLRKAGLRVRIYEERDDVGHRFNGDFQGIENWSEKEDVQDQLRKIGVEINFHCVPFYGGVVYGPDREKIEIKNDKPLFYLVRRGRVSDSLEQGLKAQALDAGVEIVFGKRIEKIEPGTITAIGPKGADAIAKGVTFETNLPDQSIGIFDDRLSPGAYSYFLICGGKATLATVLIRDYSDVNIYFQKTVKAFKELLSFEMKNPREFGGFGNFFLRPKEEHGGHLYVGESAGFQDFLWGFGMRYAMTSGYLAAQSIIHEKNYDGLWRKTLRPRLRASMINRVLVDRLGNALYRRFIRRFSKAGSAKDYLLGVYAWSPWKWLLYPYAISHYHSRVKDERCNHTDSCDCVWCRCQRKTVKNM